MITYSVFTNDNEPAVLWSDDTFTLHFGEGFDDQRESTAELLAEAVSIESLRNISAASNQNDSDKAIKSLWLIGA